MAFAGTVLRHAPDLADHQTASPDGLPDWARSCRNANVATLLKILSYVDGSGIAAARPYRCRQMVKMVHDITL